MSKTATLAAPADEAPPSASQPPDPLPTPPEATPAPLWAFGDPPHESAQPRNLTFARSQNRVQVEASGVFRRAVHAPLPAPPDRAADLLARARDAASKLDLSASRSLVVDREIHRGALTLCDQREADALRRRDDPELLAAPDFAERMRGIGDELAAVAARRTDIQRQLESVEAKIVLARRYAERDLLAVARAAAAAEFAAVEASRRDLMGRIAVFAAPLLEQLLAIDAAAGPLDERPTLAALLAVHGL